MDVLMCSIWGISNSLEERRQMGMKVIVGVDTDERIRQAKGENRPVNDLHNRIDFLRSIKYIDDDRIHLARMKNFLI